MTGGASEPTPPAFRFSQLKSRNKENNKVFVEVVKVSSIMLIEIVGELSLCIILGSYSPVEIGNTQSVTVENDRQNTVHRDGCLSASLIGGGDGVDLAGAGEIVVGARTLPVGNSLSSFHLGVDVMESVGLEVHIGRPNKLGQIDSVLEVIGSETLFLADVEQSGHSGHTVAVKTNLESGVPNEFGVGDSLLGGEGLGKSLIVEIQQIDSLYTASLGEVAGVGVVGLYGFNNHIVDGSHDERIHTDSQRLLGFILEHGDKGVQLLAAGERLLNLTFGNGTVDLESGSLVEELSRSTVPLPNVR